MLLTLGSTGEVYNQGNHWTRVIFAVHEDANINTISVTFRDTLSIKQEKQAQIEGVLVSAIQYRERSGEGAASKLFQAFPDYTATLDIASDDERQKNGWECDYLAYKRLLQDLPDSALPLPTDSEAQKRREIKMCDQSENSESLHDCVYRTLLEGVYISQNELVEQIEIPDKDKIFDFIPGNKEGEMHISSKYLSDFIKDISTVSASTGDREDLTVERRSSKLEKQYKAYIKGTSLDLQKIFPENDPELIDVSNQHIAIKARMRALVRLINNDPSEQIILCNCDCLSKLPEAEQKCVQLELDRLTKIVNIDKEEKLAGYRCLEVIKARNELIEALGLKIGSGKKIDPQGNIWTQLWLALLADSSLYGRRTPTARSGLNLFLSIILKLILLW